MGGKVSAEYYRNYRKAHPEKQARDRELRRERRRLVGRGDRTAEYRLRAKNEKRLNGDNGTLAESAIVRRAKELAQRVKQPDHRTVVYDDCYEDLVGECVLALCEGANPEVAMQRWMTQRAYHARLWAPLGDVWIS